MAGLSRRIFLAGSGLAIAACGRPKPPGAKSGPAGRINVYSARDSDADKAVYDLFTRETGIEVHVARAQGAQLVDRLRREGDRTEADLVAQDAASLWRLAQMGLLQGVKTPALEGAVPSRFRDPDGRWWAFSHSPHRLPQGRLRTRRAHLPRRSRAAALPRPGLRAFLQECLQSIHDGGAHRAQRT